MEPTIVATQHVEPYARLAPSRLHQEFQSKSVLITGGGYGIGASIARSFAEAGVAAIIVTGRTESSLKETTEELSKAYPAVKVSYQVVDITSEASVTKFFASLSDSPDVLVNNAGFLSKPENFLDAEIGEWWKSFEINVLGTVRVSQAYLRHRKLKSPNSPGVVIALNTFGAYSIRAPNLTAYSASKIALARVFEMVSTDVPESVARFISVNPGAVRTAMYDKSGLEGAADIPTTNAQLSAEFIVWAASEEASFLSGRFVWVNWDVDELVAKKEEIVEQDLLISGLRGF